MPKRLLLVDDDSSIFLAYKRLLQEPDREVDAVTTIEEVKVLLERHVYDILITDLRLSGMEGEEGFEIIRMVKTRYPDTKVIMITAYSDCRIKERARELGVAHYFEKPVSIGVLRSVVEFLEEET